jgi:hypothetical protein
VHLIVIITHGAHNDGCGPLPEKIGHFMLYCIYMNVSQTSVRQLHFTVFNFHQNSSKDKLGKDTLFG